MSTRDPSKPSELSLVAGRPLLCRDPPAEGTVLDEASAIWPPSLWIISTADGLDHAITVAAIDAAGSPQVATAMASGGRPTTSSRHSVGRTP